jgi:hypothetical protein
MAERKAGEILAGMEKAKNQHRDDTTTVSAPRLKDIGISKTQSSRWQQSAKVPEPDFQTYVESSTNAGKEITSAPFDVDTPCGDDLEPGKDGQNCWLGWINDGTRAVAE